MQVTGDDPKGSQLVGIKKAKKYTYGLLLTLCAAVELTATPMPLYLS